MTARALISAGTHSWRDSHNRRLIAVGKDPCLACLRRMPEDGPPCNTLTEEDNAMPADDLDWDTDREVKP
jgi:hypothetical protein